MSFQNEIYQIADELRGIANIGLNFTSDPYDKERYEKILAVSSRMIGAIENRDSNEILKQYQENLAHASPFVGAASVVRQDGKVLLIQRTDNQKWALIPRGISSHPSRGYPSFDSRSYLQNEFEYPLLLLYSCRFRQL